MLQIKSKSNGKCSFIRILHLIPPFFYCSPPIKTRLSPTGENWDVCLLISHEKISVNLSRSQRTPFFFSFFFMPSSREERTFLLFDFTPTVCRFCPPRSRVLGGVFPLGGESCLLCGLEYRTLFNSGKRRRLPRSLSSGGSTSPRRRRRTSYSRQ